MGAPTQAQQSTLSSISVFCTGIHHLSLTSLIAVPTLVVTLVFCTQLGMEYLRVAFPFAIDMIRYRYIRQASSMCLWSSGRKSPLLSSEQQHLF